MIDVETGADRIVIRVGISAPRDPVCQALTEEERIAQWWGGHVSLDAVASDGHDAFLADKGFSSVEWEKH